MVNRRKSVVVAAILLLYVVSGFSPTITAQYSFEEVASGLKHKDRAIRLRAIEIFKDANDPVAAAPVAATLEDPDDRVQLAAIDAERSFFTMRPLARRKKIGFVVEVRTPDAGGEAAVAVQLALLPRRVPAEVLRGLAGAMRDENPRVALEAINAFGVLAPAAGPEASTELRAGITGIMEALRLSRASSSRPSRAPSTERGARMSQVAAATAAGRAMRGCGTATSDSASLCAELGNALIATLNSRGAEVRRAAMEALGQLRYGSAVQALADQLSHYQRGPDAKAAAEALAGIGHESSLTIFKRLLTSLDPDMRRLAVEGIARTGRTEELPELEQISQNERSDSVLLALHYAALKLGASTSPDALVAALRGKSLRSFALQYLLDLSRSLGPPLAESLKDNDEETRRLVADVLGFSADPTLVPALKVATKDQDPETAAAAQRAIDRIMLAGAALASTQ